jgi:hypothetical protein
VLVIKRSAATKLGKKIDANQPKTCLLLMEFGRKSKTGESSQTSVNCSSQLAKSNSKMGPDGTCIEAAAAID